ncbi:hypothetical protein [Streptococcus acidominimus]|uniref:Uncharacterized protein n=1 Tax=Streptococcus acidominimus TaxID=1326 RepID=A0A4Y9FTG2_STRAI|nr:hypothetical protein [Streptococcus acidominimus]MBF0818249.1 hypothetical protein [Streptococcus acidominimus]MBF0838566.1 hypothetical protein [Streptococcus acidominimus]MBF0848396.1 hypothetical protein [Streptococcus danieliae]TFU31548.1 hypothetical protein E4U01_02100 [Streptococcus acidominimus]
MQVTFEQVVSVLSATVISTIITTLFSFIQTNKRNKIDFITKERSEWRKNLKNIIEELGNEGKRAEAIRKLQVQINPYGRCMDLKYTRTYFMSDGHIWDSIEGNIDYEKVIFFVELLLKYDWERSKQEITFKPGVSIRRILMIIPLILLIVVMYIAYNKNAFEFYVSAFMTILSISSFVVEGFYTSNSFKNSNVQFWIFFLFFALPYGNSLNMLYNYVPIFHNNYFSTLSFLLLISYTFIFQQLVESGEKTYIDEIERFIFSENKDSLNKKGILY